MTDHFEAMHDYLTTLELELKAQATQPAPGRRDALSWRRPAIAIGIVSMLVIPGLVLAGSIGREAPAYGKPPILKTPAVDIPQPLKQGLALQLAAGPNSTLTEARPIPAFGGTAYLLSGNDAWCLSAPDPEADHPQAETGVACTRTKEFFRIGISLVLGNHYIAAIPDGVRDPTLTRADGTTETLHPNEQGVVVVDALSAGDTVSLHGADGTSRTDRSASR
jgi:hypothetical protein